MYARRIVPFLLIAGAVMMIVHHKRQEFLGQIEEGERPAPIGPHGPHGAWGRRVPPLFEKWHQQAHAAETQAPAI